jgi:hypothetical protein
MVLRSWNALASPRACLISCAASSQAYLVWSSVSRIISANQGLERRSSWIRSHMQVGTLQCVRKETRCTWTRRRRLRCRPRVGHFRSNWGTPSPVIPARISEPGRCLNGAKLLTANAADEWAARNFVSSSLPSPWWSSASISCSLIPSSRFSGGSRTYPAGLTVTPGLVRASAMPSAFIARALIGSAANFAMLSVIHLMNGEVLSLVNTPLGVA